MGQENIIIGHLSETKDRISFEASLETFNRNQRKYQNINKVRACSKSTIISFGHTHVGEAREYFIVVN